MPSKYTKKVQFNITIPEKLRTRIMLEIPPGQASKITTHLWESYLDKTNGKEIHEINKELIQIQQQQEDLDKKKAHLEAQKLAIQHETELEKQKQEQKRKEEFQKAGQLLDSIKASGILRDLP